jgi:hypothetical protein
MNKLVEDVKAARYRITEYALDDASGTKAVESVPESSTGADERKNVVSTEDLNVPETFFDNADELAQEESRRGI